MKVLLEILRIISIFALLGTLLGAILINIYSSLNIEMGKYGWIGGVSIYLLLFVLYRNILQFSGWYKGKNNKKLAKSTTIFLLVSSVLLIFMPMLLSYLQ